MTMTKEKVKQLFEKNGYYIDDYALSKAYLSLYYLINRNSVGQEVYSLCLDGPSGCGKTSFVDAYTKVAQELLGVPVQFINFQLDAETGKDDLYEDIDVVATFESDTSKIRIPGTILKAIKLVNEGNYVILKMDEYDKARDSTDTFFNNFLQEGRINTIQHGDIQIKPENFGKLQVFLCKNDMRVDLSEPMVRRNRLIRLDYMAPDRMYQILQKFVAKNGIADELLNLVVLIYQQVYDNRSLYTKLPSCSECQQALMDAFLLLQSSGFTKKDIYTNIIENMLKIEDDVKSFESSLEKDNNKLRDVIMAMKNDDGSNKEKVDINTLIASNLFAGESKKLTDKILELQGLIDKYSSRFASLEEEHRKLLDDEKEKILLENGKLVTTERPKALSNFGDESLYVKRGFDIFQLANDWYGVAEVVFDGLSHAELIKKMIANASSIGATIYENGIMLKEEDGEHLIVTYNLEEGNKPVYKFMSSLPVNPYSFLKEISKFISLGRQIYNAQPVKMGYDVEFGIIDALIQCDSTINLRNNGAELEKIDDDPTISPVDENVYHLYFKGISVEKFIDALYPSRKTSQCRATENGIVAEVVDQEEEFSNDITSCQTASKKMMVNKRVYQK